MAGKSEMLDHRIRERAFQLWQEAGCPEGRAEEFWYRAHEVETAADEAEDHAKAKGVEDPPISDTQNFA